MGIDVKALYTDQTMLVNKSRELQVAKGSL
jgi:hypothetical protein